MTQRPGRPSLEELEKWCEEDDAAALAEPDVPVGKRNIVTYPGFSGGVRASNLGGEAPPSTPPPSRSGD